MLPSLVAAGDSLECPSKSLPYLKEYRLGVNSAWIRNGSLEKSSGLIDAVLDVTTDFSWLSKGDRVLIKLVLNSGNAFPATSDPWVLERVVRILKDKGAGR